MKFLQYVSYFLQICLSNNLLCFRCFNLFVCMKSRFALDHIYEENAHVIKSKKNKLRHITIACYSRESMIFLFQSRHKWLTFCVVEAFYSNLNLFFDYNYKHDLLRIYFKVNNGLSIAITNKKIQRWLNLYIYTQILKNEPLLRYNSSQKKTDKK